MRYILSPEEMRAAEQAAFDRGVSSLLLMETAARGAAVFHVRPERYFLCFFHTLITVEGISVHKRMI